MSAAAAGAGAGAGAATPDARLATTAAAASVPPTPSPGQRKFMQFFLGGLAGSFATCCIQPIDMVKVRLQLSGELGKGQTVRNPITMAKSIYAKEGFLAFYDGLSAGVLRQCTYGCARLGLFHGVSDHLKKSRPDPSQPLPVLQNAFAGLFAGGLGACFGTPCDLAMVRMQSDQTLPPEQRRNYRGVFHALRTIAATEGVAALWKGNVPTVWRAMGMNVGMLSTNEAAKPAFVRWFGEGLTAYFASSMLAGFAAAVFALPFDFLKTRLQKQRADATGKLPYTGLVDCAVKSFRTEGPLSVYKGFGAFWVRVTPHTVITLMAFEQLSKMSKSRGLM